VTPELDRLVVRRDGRAVLTAAGRLLANAVTALLVVAPVPDASGAAGDGADGREVHRQRVDILHP
jgi:hypothetical protein